MNKKVREIGLWQERVLAKMETLVAIQNRMKEVHSIDKMILCREKVPNGIRKGILGKSRRKGIRWSEEGRTISRRLYFNIESLSIVTCRVTIKVSFHQGVEVNLIIV